MASSLQYPFRGGSLGFQTMAELETERVLTAFDRFTEASAHMEAAYKRLASQFQSLSAELEETNRRLERTVRDKERIGSHLRAVLDSLSCGVLVADREGRITHSNRAAENLIGSVHGAEGPRPIEVLDEIVRAHPELAPPFDADGPTPFEARIVGLGNAPERCLQVERRELIQPGLSAEGAVFVIRDLTELRALEAQAQRMERLAAMGEMALELAHEVRNPLGGIRLHASLLGEHEPLSAAGRDWLAQVQVGIRSLDNVVSNMLSFGCPQEPQRLPADLSELCEEVERFLEPLMRERNVRVEIHDDAKREVLVDRDQFRQVLLNLWLNALNAMPRGGELTVGLRVENGAMVMELRDSGPGLTEEILDHLFDPFFTTDRRGTGLGLAVASQIIRQHGGDIRAESAPGEGATFRITLPVSPLKEEPCAVTC